MSRRPDILTLTLIELLGWPNGDDDGKTSSYCAVALGMAAAMRDTAVRTPSASDQGGQLGAGGDAELGIGLVQVMSDGTGGQEQLGGNVAVG
jgi:hypothetical protein